MVNECKVKNQDESQSGPEKKCKCHGTCDECAAKVSPEPIKNAFCPGEGAKDNSCSSSEGGVSESSNYNKTESKKIETTVHTAMLRAGSQASITRENLVKLVSGSLRHRADMLRSEAQEQRDTAQHYLKNPGLAGKNQEMMQARFEKIANDKEREAAKEEKLAEKVEKNGIHPSVIAGVKDLKVNAFNPRSLESGKFKPYGAGTGKGPAHWAAQKGALLFTDEDRRLGTLAREEKAATGQNPASWVADEATWEKAKSAADKSYTEGDDAYWPAVTAIYKRMGGAVKSESNNAFTANMRSPSMAKSKKSGREEVLDWLTTNVSSLKSSTARDTLDELPDEALQELYVNSYRANEKTLVCNAVASRWPEINEVVTNGGDIEAFLKSKMGGGEEEEEEVEVENGSKVKNISGDDCEGEDQDSECRAMFAAQDTNNSAGGKKMKVNCQGPAKKLSFSELLAQSGDAEAQAVWNHAVEVEREERKKLLQRITANCDRSEAKAMWDDLKGLPLPKLRRLANNVVPQVEELPQRNGLFGAGHRIPDYAGASGGLVGNRGRRNDDDEGTLELPNANALLGK